jgi:arabinogalactan oligomer/maltooligosaccharide transport system substrate-binding protein
MVRRVFSGLLSIVLVFSMVGCGNNSGDGSGETSSGYSYEQVMAKFEGDIEQGAIIRVLDNQMSVETGFLQEMLTAFNEKYKEYGVNAVDANMDQYVDLEQNGPDGYGPDVLYQANDMLMRYAEGGHILPLPTTEMETGEIPQTLIDAYLMPTYGLDLYYGMPIALQSTVLTYRKDLLPDNWETEWDKDSDAVPDMVQYMNDLYAYSTQVKEESGGGKYGLYMSLVDQYFNSEYLLSYGGYIFGDSSTDIGLANPDAETGLQLFRDLAGVLGSACITQDVTTQAATYLTDEKGTVFCTIGTPDWLTTYRENLAVTYVRGGMDAAEADRLAVENLVVMAPPRLPTDGDITKTLTDGAAETFEPTTMGGVNAFGISAYTKYPKASLAFVKFVTEYANAKLRSEALGSAPARSDIAEEIGGVSLILSNRVEAGLIYMMPSSRDTMYIWTPLESLFKDVATDNTTREIPIYTTKESLQQLLDKLVTDVQSAMEVSNG